MGRLLTSGELAKELGVSFRTIQRWFADGVITPKYRTAGRHGRYDADEVQEQLREHEKRSGQ
ncbi:hypothetical protein GCM10009836_43040 [Pseudonocardia ailaonensis]|uniref:HTH merR-type domain-containing protein n=1 Tax=Pseudonocardia ailaonensis TaxID=367279 RepID=A0ABN2N8Y5_9PSEU